MPLHTPLNDRYAPVKSNRVKKTNFTTIVFFLILLR